MRAHRYSDADLLRDPQTGELNKPEFRRRLRGWLAVLLAFAVLLGGFGFAAVQGYQAYQAIKTEKDYPGPGLPEDAEVKIPEQLTTLQIGKLLVDAGVIKDAKKFQQTATARPDLWSKVQAGKFRLQKQVPSLTALQQLTDPQRAVRVWLTYKEGWRLAPQIIGETAKRTGLEAADVTAAASALSYPAWCTGKDVVKGEGFIFPDTYEVPDGVKPDTMLKKAVKQFTEVSTQLDFVAQAGKLDFKNPQDSAEAKACKALTVASIIDREVFRADDRAKVARVIYNRLNKGMKLELDSTVAYANNKTDTIWTTPEQRKLKSPYNTYLNAGLPPGPISNPGEAAMTAAIHPEAGDWLYFVPVNLDTGETVFTTSLAEHQAATQKLHQWCAASPQNQAKCK